MDVNGKEPVSGNKIPLCIQIPRVQHAPASLVQDFINGMVNLMGHLSWICKHSAWMFGQTLF